MDPVRLNQPVRLNLATDEAVVMLWFLTRELWGDQDRLAKCTEHPAEFHALHALLQELIQPLMWTGGTDSDEICRAARDSVMARHT